MVFGGVQRDAGIGELATHARVALEREWFVVVVRVDRLHAELVRELDELVTAAAVAHKQAGVSIAEGAQLLIEIVPKRKCTDR